ncbi:MAG: PD-(D/E)XK nuclease family protein [Actinobacteria bacterium]|nr:PD-(D/E)XK nuclease family protein [Actinomycetota bacterium]
MYNQKNGKIKVSYTHISTFEKCPLLYKYRFIDKIPTPPSKHLSFGNSVHQALEYFQRQLLSGGIEIFSDTVENSILAFLEQSWKSEGFESQSEEEEWKEKARYALKYYFLPWIRSQMSSNYNIVAIEERFEIDIDKCILTGKIDRVDYRKENGSIYYRIVDFKTGEKVPRKMQNSEDTQLYIYTLGAEKIIQQKLSFPDLKPENLILEKIMYFYVIPNNEVENTIEESHRNFILSKINEQIDSLINATENNIYPPRTGRHCEWCDFRDICPAFKELFILSQEKPTNKQEILENLIDEWEKMVQDIAEKERQIYELMQEMGIYEFEYNGKIFKISN